MSIQSNGALPCIGCNTPIYYTEYHIPHCPNTNQNPIMTHLQEKAKGKVPRSH